MVREFKKLDDSEYGLWDSYVRSNPTGTIFHTTRWLRCINPSVEVWVQMNRNNIVGGVALTKTRKNGISAYHIPPYTPYFGPLFGNEIAKRESISSEHEFLNGLLRVLPNSGHFDFKLSPGHHSVFPYYIKGYSCEVVQTHIIDGTFEQYISVVNKNKYRELLKLLKLIDDGVIEVRDNIDDMEFVALLKQTGLRNRYSIHEKYVKALLKAKEANIYKQLGIFTKEDGLISVGLFPFDNCNVYNLINASLRIQHPVLKTVNLLLMHKAIEFCLKENKRFDFEGSMLEGVEFFCRSLGGEQVPVYRLQKTPSLYYSFLRSVKLISNGRK